MLTICMLFPLLQQCKDLSMLQCYWEQLLDHTEKKAFPQHEVALDAATNAFKCYFVTFR